MNDQLQRFMFDKAPVRGEFVTLQQTWQDVLARRDYPAPIRTMLGEMMAAAALLSANLKFDGALVIQIYGDGPVRMLVVQCNSDLSMRATAKLSARYEAHTEADLQASTEADIDVNIDAAYEAIPDDATFADLVNVSGAGRCAITLDPRNKQPGQQPYQGVVPLTDANGDPIPTIAKVLEHYMHHSEQLDTRLWLAANGEQAVGMLLQKLPSHGGNVTEGTLDADAWDRVCALGGTIKPAEMLSVDGETLLHRLFWEETLQGATPSPTRFACTCSREKVGGMLTMLGREEVEGILVEKGEVEVHCEFCNQRYAFDAVDAAQLFLEAGATSVAPASERQH